MKHFVKILIFILVVAGTKFSGCEQEDLDFFIDCDSCLSYYPDSADLIVQVIINDENPFVPLTFYRGDYENGKVDWVDTARNKTLYLYSEIGREYSVKATYQSGGQTIIAVDGDKMKVVNGEGECYPPCYYVKGGTLDVRLKE